MTEKNTRILSLGAGVQSTCVALMSVHGEIEPVEHAIFSDTGWESKSVYKHLAWLTPIMEEAGIQVHKVKASPRTKNMTGNIRQDALSDDVSASMPIFLKDPETGGMGTAHRQCTSDYKIIPVQAKEREIIGLAKGSRWRPENGYITNVMGISLDEIQRMKDNRLKYIENEFPLIDLRMTRNDCMQWMKRNGYPEPPRSACIGCPYHSNFEWRHMKLNDPESFADAVDFDYKLREQSKRNVGNKYRNIPYLHRSGVPLDQVDLRNEEDMGQMNLFGEECEGMCGV